MVRDMNSELSEDQFSNIEDPKAKWVEIIHQWAVLRPMDPIPAYTKEHAQKMLKKLG